MDCPTIIIGDFNINMLTNTLQSMELQKYGLKLVFFETTTIYNTQIDHILTNTCANTTTSFWIHRSLLDSS